MNKINIYDVKTPTILGVVALVIAIFTFVLQISLQRSFNLDASPNSSVRNVTVSNITDQSASISWTTEDETYGLIKWGKNYDSLGNSASSSKNKKGTIHKARLTSLQPLTTYLVAIYANGKESNLQHLWSFTTNVAQADYIPKATILFPDTDRESS